MDSTGQGDACANGAFTLTEPDCVADPVILAVPHAGRNYPEAIADNLAVGKDALLRLEDRYADLLVREAADRGFATLVARLPRAWLDLNRAPDELDPGMFDGVDSQRLPQPSVKVRGGLGLVPRRLSGIGEIWKRKWLWRDVESRIEQFHAPYHRALDDWLSDCLQSYGAAVLIDVHSMPSLSSRNDRPAPDIVLGDAFGRSAGGRMSDIALSCLRENGRKVAHNDPYPGGYVLRRHGNPAHGVHAIQIEVDRALYLDSEGREPGRGMAGVARAVADLAERLAEEILQQGFLQAAE